MSIHIPPALHHRGFTLLWIAVMASVAGSQMQSTALLWHIRQLTEEPIYLSGVGLARFIPILLFSLVGGAVADAYNRRIIVFCSQSILALSALVLAWLTFNERITFWHMYALTAIQGVAIVFGTPARQSMVPNLVPVRDLSSAFSMSSIAIQAGAILGPGLGGLLIAYLGQPYSYLFSVFAYAVGLVALFLMGEVEQQAVAGGLPAVNLSAIIEGIRFILNHPVILSTMILDFFATFFSSARTLLPIFARDILNVGALEYGWLAAAESIGAVGAALVVSQFESIRRQGLIFLGSVVVFGLATIAFGLAPTFLAAMLALIVIGATDSVSAIIRNTLRQLQTPDYIRGRMTSVNQIFFMGGPELGEVEAGVVAQLFGASFAVVSGGIGCILATIWVAKRWPQLRRYNGDEPVMAGAVAD